MSAKADASAMAQGLATAAAQRRKVGPLRATRLCYWVLIRQIFSVPRLAALSALGAVMVLVGWVVGRAGTDPAAVSERSVSQALVDGASYADGFGLIVIVPIVSLVFAAASLGDLRDDGTLVYLWLRPMGRASLAVAAAAASVSVSLPICAAPTVLGGWLATGLEPGADKVALGAFAAAALGTAAYSCLFVLGGLLFRKAVMWGTAYVLLWEGLAVGLGDFAARLSLRGYTRSVMSHVAEVPFEQLTNGFGASLWVLACVSVVAIALAAVRLRHIDVA